MPLTPAPAAPEKATGKDRDEDAGTSESRKTDAAVTSSLTVEELAGSQFWPVRLREMIAYGLSLTPRGLNYTFGSSDPDEGGMDCSGTLYHVMIHEGFKKVPRSSDDMFHWVQDAGLLNRVTGTPEQDDSSLAAMRPGDLLFWTGTYDTGDAERISHVMLYLGKTTEGDPVMFGASNGRPYQGKRQNGVSVFDFRMPRAEGKARFAGYGPIPGMEIDSIAPQPPTQGKVADMAGTSWSASKLPDSKSSTDSTEKNRRAGSGASKLTKGSRGTGKRTESADSESGTADKDAAAESETNTSARKKSTSRERADRTDEKTKSSRSKTAARRKKSS
jgi:hypothetical protein